MAASMKSSLKQLVSLFRALGQPARVRIILALGEGEACVCHLESALKLRQAYLSQQLMALRDAGIVKARREGRNIYYRLTNPKLLEVIQESAGYLAGARLDIESVQVSTHFLDGCVCPSCSDKLERETMIHEDVIRTLSI